MDKEKRPRWEQRLDAGRRRLPSSPKAEDGGESNTPAGSGERLQKILAQAGIASRRSAEQLIRAGRVSVNGEVVTELGSRANPGVDEIKVDGTAIKSDAHGQGQRMVYVALNKPLGTVSTATDPFDRPTVLSLLSGARLREQGLRVFPVGRLDADSSGLILLTNDGDLTFRLTHPRYGVDKEYEVVVRGRPGQEAIQRLKEGVEIEGGLTAPARVEDLGRREGNTRLRIIIHEGRKRQVRLMTAAVGHPVIELRRTRFGPIGLADLEPGKWRNLAVHEVHALRKAVGLKPDVPGSITHPRPAPEETPRPGGNPRGQQRPYTPIAHGTARPSRPAGGFRQDRPSRPPGAFGSPRPNRPYAAPGGGERSDRPRPFGDNRPRPTPGFNPRGPEGVRTRPGAPLRRPVEGEPIARGNAGERTERGGREERPFTPRGPSRPGERAIGRTDRPMRPSRPGGPPRSDRPSGFARPTRPDRPGGFARPVRPADRPGGFARPEGNNRPDRPYRPERSERLDRPVRPVRARGDSPAPRPAGPSRPPRYAPRPENGETAAPRGNYPPRTGAPRPGPARPFRPAGPPRQAGSGGPTRPFRPAGPPRHDERQGRPPARPAGPRGGHGGTGGNRPSRPGDANGRRRPPGRG